MKFFILLFFVGLAVSRAEICGKERVENCAEKLIEVLLADESENEVCRELENSLYCLQAAAADCLEQTSDEIDDSLNELQKILIDNCQEAGLSIILLMAYTTDKCFQDNEDYIKECEYELPAKLISLMPDSGVVNDDLLFCLAYLVVADCVIERVGEKCGVEAKQAAEVKFIATFEYVKKVCDAAGV